MHGDLVSRLMRFGPEPHLDAERVEGQPLAVVVKRRNVVHNPLEPELEFVQLLLSLLPVGPFPA